MTPPRVEIIWTDAAFNHGPYDLEDARQTLGGVRTRTIGYLVSEGDGHYSLAMAIQAGNFVDVMEIPEGCVEKVNRLD